MTSTDLRLSQNPLFKFLLVNFRRSDEECRSDLKFCFSDASQVSETVIFRLASEAPLSVFNRIMLISAGGDRYVSPHSARIENAKAAFSDKVNGQSNIELIERLQRNIEHSDSTVERYHVIHQGLPTGN